MGGKDYLLTQGEYGVEQRIFSDDYSLSCEYLIDNTRTTDVQKEVNKKLVLQCFYDNVDSWENEIDIKIVSVGHLGYHIYMIDMACHKYKEEGVVISLGYVHKDDVKNYLARRGSHNQ